MMQDDRTTQEAMAGLFDSDMLNTSAFSRAAPEVETPAAPAPAERLSVLEQMDERHGKLKSRLGLFSHLYGGGDEADYGDTDLQTAHKIGLLGDQFEGIDINNPTMAQVATVTQLDAGLGKQALENYVFNQRVGDLGRAQGFMNDGVEDENDLWAQEIYGRYGKTSGGATGAVSAAASSMGISPQEFLELPAEVQETALYNMGDEGYRKSADVLGGRDVDTIMSTQEAEAQGASAGELYKTAMTNVSSLHTRQRAGRQSLDQAQYWMDQLSSGELETGKFQTMFKDAFDIYTRADGELELAGVDNMIERINQATFGALSENEMRTLKESFASMAKGGEYNKGTLDGIMKKVNREMSNNVESGKRDLKRIQKDNPEEYDRLMEDDWNWRTIGPGSEIKGFTTSGGKEVSFNQYWDSQSENGASRAEIINGFAELKAQEKVKIEMRDKEAKEQQDKADGIMDSLIMGEPVAEARPRQQAPLSPYIARPQ